MHILDSALQYFNIGFVGKAEWKGQSLHIKNLNASNKNETVQITTTGFLDIDDLPSDSSRDSTVPKRNFYIEIGIRKPSQRFQNSG